MAAHAELLPLMNASGSSIQIGGDTSVLNLQNNDIHKRVSRAFMMMGSGGKVSACQWAVICDLDSMRPASQTSHMACDQCHALGGAMIAATAQPLEVPDAHTCVQSRALALPAPI